WPDFPGCITAGSTFAEAMDMAREALAGHIASMTESGERIPEPSSIDTIVSDPENLDGVAVLIPTAETEDKLVRVNVTLPEALLKRIDAVASNRSKFLAKAAERALQES
ncbi:MAG: type II toxin-antitoxin system HicB family antitoxin, partial [Stellaceae bacterium]